MAKKMNFDFKQFLLEKGERFGLGLAVGITALLVVMGVMVGLGKSSPLPQLTKNTADLESRVQTKNPDNRPAAMPSPPRFDVDLDPQLASLWEWLIRNNLEDDKKRNPVPEKLLVKDEQLVSQVDVLRVPVRVVDYVPEKEVKTLSADANKPDPQKLAEKIRPTRMIIFSAVFPYDKQVTAFRRALRIKKGEKLSTPPKFLGFHVVRRVTLPDGTIKKMPDGKDYEMLVLDEKRSDDEKKSDDGKKSLFRKFMSAAAGLAPWDKNQKEVAYPGLVMPVPALAADVTYPPVVLDGLPKPVPLSKDDEDDKKAKGEKKGGSNLTISSMKWDDEELFKEEIKDRLSGKSIQVFDPYAGAFNPDAGKKGDTAGTGIDPRAGDAQAAAEKAEKGAGGGQIP